MDRIVRNAFGALRLDKKTYDRLFFDDYATADAVLIVVVVSALRLLTAIVLVSYAKARAELVVEKLDVGLLERGERIGLLAIAAFFDQIVPILWILLVGSVITVYQRFALAYREMERLDADERQAKGETSA